MRIYISFVLLVLLFGCGQSSNGTVDISEKINDYLGVTPYLPETDYPIGNVLMEYRTNLEGGVATKGDPVSARIEYKVSLDEKVDEELRKTWEEDNTFTEIIYGDLYRDDNAISVIVDPWGTGESMGSELIEIAGHEVQYQYIQREGFNAVTLRINFEDIGYQIQYQVEEDDIEEEAKAFAREIINNH